MKINFTIILLAVVLISGCHYLVVDQVAPPAEPIRTSVEQKCASMPGALKVPTYEILEAVENDQKKLNKIADGDLNQRSLKRALEIGERMRSNISTIIMANDPKWSALDYAMPQHWTIDSQVYLPTLRGISEELGIENSEKAWEISTISVDKIFYYGIEAPEFLKDVKLTYGTKKAKVEYSMQGSALDMCHFRTTLVILLKAKFKARDFSTEDTLRYFKLTVKNWIKV